MHNQPSPETGLSKAACIYLSIMAISATSLVGVIVAQVVAHVSVVQGLSGLFAATAAISGGGCVIRMAQDTITHRLDHLEQSLAEQGAVMDEESAAAAHRLNMRLLNNRH